MRLVSLPCFQEIDLRFTGAYSRVPRDAGLLSVVLSNDFSEMQITAIAATVMSTIAASIGMAVHG